MTRNAPQPKTAQVRPWLHYIIEYIVCVPFLACKTHNFEYSTWQTVISSPEIFPFLYVLNDSFFPKTYLEAIPWSENWWA